MSSCCFSDKGSNCFTLVVLLFAGRTGQMAKNASREVYTKCSFYWTWHQFLKCHSLFVFSLGDIAHLNLHTFKREHPIAIQQFSQPDKNKMDFKNSVVETKLEQFLFEIICGKCLRVILALLQVLGKTRVSNQARQGFS